MNIVYPCTLLSCMYSNFKFSQTLFNSIVTITMCNLSKNSFIFGHGSKTDFYLTSISVPVILFQRYYFLQEGSYLGNNFLPHFKLVALAILTKTIFIIFFYFSLSWCVAQHALKNESVIFIIILYERIWFNIEYFIKMNKYKMQNWYHYFYKDLILNYINICL